MSSRSAARRLLGLLGSWALFVLGFGLASIAAAGQWINIQDSRKLARYAAIETLLGERASGRAAEMGLARGRSQSAQALTRSKLAEASRVIGRTPGKARAAAFPSAGGPPDEYFVEMARRHGKNVIPLGAGQAIDADTGMAAQRIGGGVWRWIGESSGSRRILTIENDTVVELAKGAKRELPAGALILAGGTLVIPPPGSPQRRFDKLPSNLDAPPKIVPPAQESEKLAEPGKPLPSRGRRLREAGESLFGGRKG